MQFLRFNYLSAAANHLIPKWAKNWKHPEQIAEFRDAFKDDSPSVRKERLEACRKIGWRLSLAFHTENEYERDWLLYEARRVNASYFPQMVIETNDSQPDDKVEILSEGNPTDSLLRFVQQRLVKRMAVCPGKNCRKRFYFRDPGRHGQRYCGRRCADIARTESQYRWKESQK